MNTETHQDHDGKEKLEDKENNIDTIINELKRQFGVHERIFKKHDTTSGIIIGLSGAILAYIILQGNFLEIIKFENTSIGCIFYIGLGFIVLSAFLSFYTLMQKEYDVGPETKAFFDKYRRETETSYEFKLNLFREMHHTDIENTKVIKHKGLFAKTSIIVFVIGYFLILIAKIL